MSSRGAIPIREQLSRAILARLESIGTKAGYNVTLKPRRFALQRESPEDLTAELQDGDDRAADEPDTPQQRNAWWAVSDVFVYIAQTPTPELTFDARCHIARADVELAIMKDPTFGGLARRSRLLGMTLFDDVDVDMCGVMVRFESLYYTHRKNPYSINGE